ncbi:MAG: diguanylate cyclase [Sulfurimonas sp.]
MRKFLFAFLFLFGALFGDEKVVLQLKWLHQFQFAGYYAALEKGYYKDVGLDVEIRERDLNKSNIKQVIDGEAEYGIADSVLFLHKAKQEPVVIVAAIFQHSPNVLLTLKSSGIDSPYKLQNKDITFYKKDVDGFGILAMLKSLHVEPNISRVKEETNYTYLADKKTDAYVSYLSNEPFYFKEMGTEINIINPANYGFDLYGDMLFTSVKEVAEHPQRVEKFKEATLKGWKYAFEHKEEIINLIKKKYATNKSIEHLRYEADALEQLTQQKSTPMGTIDNGRVEFILGIYEKYGLIKNSVPIEEYIFDPLKSKNIFTQEEKSYLKEKKVINICIDSDWMPFEKNEGGKYIGIGADYVALFEKSIGIPIRMVTTKNWAESITYLKERKCDILSLAMPTKERESYLDFTKAYFKTPVVIVTKPDELYIDDIIQITDKKIGIIKGYAYGEILRKRYPRINFEDVESIKEGLDKVCSGALFAYVDTLVAAGYNIQKDYLGELKIAGKFGDTWDLSVATRNDEPILKEIFDKAVELISSTTQQEIFNKWVSVHYDKAADYAAIFKWVGLVAILFTIFLLMGLFANRRLRVEIVRRKKIEKELAKLSITDELTSLYNRRYFNEIFPKLINSAKRENENICFAMADIDFFKQYNDTYGHVAGDEVLRGVANVMKESLHRADDYCFRLGGEEFGILFKGLRAQEAKELVESMRENIENLQIAHKKNSASKYLTASFGLAVKNANSIEDLEELYKEVDELLYEAKQAGRNRVVATTSSAINKEE